MMTSRVGRVSSDGIFLFLGLFTVLQVCDVAFATQEIRTIPCEIPPGKNALRAEQHVERDAHLISGELISVDGDYYSSRMKVAKK